MIFFHAGATHLATTPNQRVIKDSFGEPLDSALTALFREEDLPFEARMERFTWGLERTTDLAQLQSLRQALTTSIISSVRVGGVRKASIWDVAATRYYETMAAPEPSSEEHGLLTLEEMKEVFQKGGGLYVSFVKKSTGESRWVTITS